MGFALEMPSSRLVTKKQAAMIAVRRESALAAVRADARAPMPPPPPMPSPPPFGALQQHEADDAQRQNEMNDQKYRFHTIPFKAS